MTSIETEQALEKCVADAAALAATVEALVNSRLALVDACADDPTKRDELRAADAQIDELESDLEIAQAREKKAKDAHRACVLAEKRARLAVLREAGNTDAFASKLRKEYIMPLLEMTDALALRVIAANAICDEQDLLAGEEAEIAREIGGVPTIRRFSPDAVRMAGQSLIVGCAGAKLVAHALTPIFDEEIFVDGIKVLNPAITSRRDFAMAEALLTYVKGT